MKILDDWLIKDKEFIKDFKEGTVIMVGIFIGMAGFGFLCTLLMVILYWCWQLLMLLTVGGYNGPM